MKCKYLLSDRKKKKIKLLYSYFIGADRPGLLSFVVVVVVDVFNGTNNRF